LLKKTNWHWPIDFSLKVFAEYEKEKLENAMYENLSRMVDDFPDSILTQELKLYLQTHKKNPKFISTIIFIYAQKT